MHSLSDIPIISLPIVLHLAAPAPSSSLLFATWGKVSDECQAEKRALICINLRPISREGAGMRERASEQERDRVPPPPPIPHL